MIKETDLQKQVVDAVRANGGEATKLSNRFLVGVCDLLIKLPGYPAMLIEAKKDTYPIKNCRVKLDVTKLQEKFLTDYAAAGMMTGVISFLIGPKRQLWVRATSIASAIACDYHMLVTNYVEIPLGKREPIILWALQDFAATYEKTEQ